MGNNNVKQLSNFNHRPHSVLGLRSEERLSALGDLNSNGRDYPDHKLRPTRAQGKALLPPLPRSHSFHQILRPTENGVNLIQKGTIRGIDNPSNKAQAKEQLFTCEEMLNNELDAILRARRCRSEADHLEDEEEEEERDDCSESRSSSHKSGLDRSDVTRKGLTNGVAARIHRAKYHKGPAPPPPAAPASSNERNSFQNTNYGHQHSQQNSHLMDKSVLTTCLESNISNSKPFGESRNGVNRHIEMPIKELKQPESRQKVGLIRRLSEKSYLSSKLSDNGEEASLFKDNFMMIPRLKSNNNHFQLNRKHSDNEQSNGLKSLTTGLNGHSNGHNHHRHTNMLNEPSLNEVNELISREFAIRNKQTEKNFSLELLANRLSELDKLIEKKDKICEKEKNRLNNKAYHEGKNICNRNNHYLPTAFDDNFILKRSTPTAGLFQNGKSPDFVCNRKKTDLDLYPRRVSELHDSDFKRSSPDLLSSDRYLSKNLNFNSNHWLPPGFSNSPPLSSLNVVNPLASLNSLFAEDSNGRGRKYELLKESSFCRSTSLRQLNHSSFNSDSANFSDEEEDEDEIKVVLKPFLPPPRRMALEERVIIDDDLFNGVDDVSATKYGRQKCWTPMEDLTSSDDDDGINCDNPSEDEDLAIRKRDIRDMIHTYDTRFTLKNQLRTLIQNSKPRLPYIA